MEYNIATIQRDTINHSSIITILLELKFPQSSVATCACPVSKPD